MDLLSLAPLCNRVATNDNRMRSGSSVLQRKHTALLILDAMLNLNYQPLGSLDSSPQVKDAIANVLEVFSVFGSALRNMPMSICELKRTCALHCHGISGIMEPNACEQYRRAHV